MRGPALAQVRAVFSCRQRRARNDARSGGHPAVHYTGRAHGSKNGGDVCSPERGRAVQATEGAVAAQGHARVESGPGRRRGEGQGQLPVCQRAGEAAGQQEPGSHVDPGPDRDAARDPPRAVPGVFPAAVPAEESEKGAAGHLECAGAGHTTAASSAGRVPTVEHARIHTHTHTTHTQHIHTRHTNTHLYTHTNIFKSTYGHTGTRTPTLSHPGWAARAGRPTICWRVWRASCSPDRGARGPACSSTTPWSRRACSAWRTTLSAWTWHAGTAC